MRGSVSGSLWGLVLGIAGLGVASQVGNPPADRPAPAPVGASEVAPVEVDTPVASVDQAELSEPVEETDIATADDNETQTDTVAAVEPVEAEPPVVGADSAIEPNEVAADEDTLPAIADVPDEPRVPVASEASAPVLLAEDEREIDADTTTTAPAVTTDQPTIDVADPSPDVETQPNDLTTASDTQVALADVAPALELPVPSDLPLVDALPVPEVIEEPVTQEITQPTAPVVEEDVTRVPDVTAEIAPPVVEAEPVVATPVIVEEPDPEIAPSAIEPATPVEPEVLAQAEPAAPIAPEIETSEDATDEAETPALPASNGGVVVNRPGADVSEPAGAEAEVVAEAELPDDAPALQRFAAAFENVEALPMVSMILVDNGDVADAAKQVAALGFPVTVILDPLAADAAAKMAAYRAAGLEVGLQASLPAGATPTDVEVAFEAAFGVVPDAVVLFSDGDDGVQNDRSVTEQVMQVLAADGRGLVAVQRGLGNALRTAEQASVPAVQVLRDLDGEGQSQAAIGRALDQAAFRARQTGDAVLLARVKPDTLRALADWAGKLGNDQFKVAPVTAVLNEPTE